MRRPRTLAGRLFLWQLSVVLVVLVGMGLVLDRSIERIALALLVAAGLTAGGALLAARSVARSLRRATAPLAALGEGDLSSRLDPGAGTEEFTVLASTLNRVAEQLQRQMQASADERRTRDLILSSMDEGILLLDPGGRARFANPAVERHLGSPPAATSNLSPLALQDAARRAAAESRPVPFDVETGAPVRSLRGAAVPVGEDGSVLLVLRDVTESKRIDAVRRDFVANASHELKTPAAAIRAAAETLRSAAADDPEVVPRFAAQLEREAVRLTRIVADLLDLSRLEGGSDLAELVALDALVREEVSRLDDVAGTAGVTLTFNAGAKGATPPVRGSSRDLSLLFRNLVDNAIRYTKPGGSVEVELEPEDGEVVLRVRDTGVGIPSRDLPRIFERFYRVDRARSRETGGTGLGLSIVKHVAENHGGTVMVRSELGRGTSFEVRIPAT